MRPENTTFGAMTSPLQFPFHTALPLDTGRHPFNYASKIMMWGSCFSTSIYQKLAADQFQVDESPFGIVYNPLVMARQLERLLNNLNFQEHDIQLVDGLYSSPWHHGSFNHPQIETILVNINKRFTEARHALSIASHLLLTWGHTQLFTDVDTGLPVANCHKRPAADFYESNQSLQDLIPVYENLIISLRQFNPDLRIILTVSPVRYLRSGFVNNTRSKATLHLLAGHLSQWNVDYFPAYELLVDELRDYRFYADDMIHPSSEAVRFIYDRFMRSWFDPAENELLKEVRQITSLVTHRPLHPNSPGYLKHLQLTNNRLEIFRKKWSEYPFLFNAQMPAPAP